MSPPGAGSCERQRVVLVSGEPSYKGLRMNNWEDNTKQWETTQKQCD